MQNNSQPDWYEILQVHPKAEPEVIKGAYKRLSHKYHPDHNQNPDENKRMKDINAAWEVLGDPNERAAYDARRQRRQEAAQREQEAKWRAEEVKKAQEAQRRQEEILRAEQQRREQEAQRQREVDEKLRMQAEERQTAESMRASGATGYIVTSRVAVAEKEKREESLGGLPYLLLKMFIVPLLGGVAVAGSLSISFHIFDTHIPILNVLLDLIVPIIVGAIAVGLTGYNWAGGTVGIIWGILMISVILYFNFNVNSVDFWGIAIVGIPIMIVFGWFFGSVGGSLGRAFLKIIGR